MKSFEESGGSATDAACGDSREISLGRQCSQADSARAVDVRVWLRVWAPTFQVVGGRHSGLNAA